jgi:glucose/mannose transport system permease protein
MQTRTLPATLLLYGTLVLLAIAYLMPVYLTLITSLKFPGDISLPQSWQLPPQVNYSSFSRSL